MSSRDQPLLSLRDQKAAVERMLRMLVNASLRDLCRYFSLPVSGIKTVLQNRLIQLLNQIVERGDVRSFNELKLFTESPHLLNNLPAGSLNSSLSARAAFPSPAPTPKRQPHYKSATGGAPVVPSLNGFEGSLDSPSQNSSTTMPKNANLDAIPAAERFIWGKAPYSFKPSPFYRALHYIGNASLPLSSGARQQVDLKLVFQTPVLQDLQADTSLRVLVYCGDSRGPKPADVIFPQHFELRVNSEEVKTNFKGVKGKPGTTRPVDITPFIKKASNNNKVTFTYAVTLTDYRAVVMVSKKASETSMVQQISTRVITKESVLSEMRAKAKDTDIVCSSTIMSLKDPISYSRIRIPCRSTQCKHNQCFDCSSFLQLQQQATSWNCPICNKRIQFEQLAVDRYFKEILSQTSESVEKVTIEPDGRWAPFESANTNPGHAGSSSNNTQQSTNDADDSDDDLVEITDHVVPKSTPSQHGARSVSTNIGAGALQTPRSVSTEGTTPATAASISGGRGFGQKRPHQQIIDLTLSSDEDPEPPRKQPSHHHVGGSVAPANNGVLPVRQGSGGAGGAHNSLKHRNGYPLTTRSPLPSLPANIYGRVQQQQQHQQQQQQQQQHGGQHQQQQQMNSKIVAAIAKSMSLMRDGASPVGGTSPSVFNISGVGGVSGGIDSSSLSAGSGAIRSPRPPSSSSQSTNLAFSNQDNGNADSSLELGFFAGQQQHQHQNQQQHQHQQHHSSYSYGDDGNGSSGYGYSLHYVQNGSGNENSSSSASQQGFGLSMGQVQGQRHGG